MPALFGGPALIESKDERELRVSAGHDIVTPMLPPPTATLYSQTLGVPSELAHPESRPKTDDEAQGLWAARSVEDRLRVIKRARHLLAAETNELCAAISPTLARNAADTMCSEILPLLSALKFLERNSATILKPKRLGRSGRPVWLMGVSSEIHRVPMGRVLVIAPSNYPLFLPGVQVSQALAAGNAAIWKPGLGGENVAVLFADVMRRAGLPHGLLTVTAETVEAARQAIAGGVDKVFFTGSAMSGKALLAQLAETLTPCVTELSGCDAVFVLPSADLSRVVKALTFGMRLNGSATCMAPRRIIVVGADDERRKHFTGLLLTALDWVKGVRLSARVEQELRVLLGDAVAQNARVHSKLEILQQPVLVTGVTPTMRVAQADIFAPVLSLMEAQNIEEALAMNDACPFALTAGVFGDEQEARAMAMRLPAGTVTINDLMVPAADPRTPFGGSKSSGFGTTQGAEGLLEMTSPKTIAVRRGSSTRHFDATTASHEPLFEGIIKATHAATWRERIVGIMQVMLAAKVFNSK